MGKNIILKIIVKSILRTRQFNNKCIKKYAQNIKNKKILEIGSGKKRKNKYYYSVKNYFDCSNDFIRSDVNKKFGHTIIDVANMEYTNKFDIIICMNVLEHIYNFQDAIKNIYKALKFNGTVIIFIPFLYHLHEEPHDYWRFTEYSLKKLLNDFSIVKIKHSGFKKYPFAYYIEAKK